MNGSVMSFNTWAREEPNLCVKFTLTSRDRFQYLGSRGTQLAANGFPRRTNRFNTWAREEPNISMFSMQSGLHRFNTWAREEPNHDDYPVDGGEPECFNTWAREEPNLRFGIAHITLSGFNTWAREEPNTSDRQPGAGTAVSILGLARNPTA